jgi:hypothetical protein
MYGMRRKWFSGLSEYHLNRAFGPASDREVFFLSFYLHLQENHNQMKNPAGGAKIGVVDSSVSRI